MPSQEPWIANLNNVTWANVVHPIARFYQKSVEVRGDPQEVLCPQEGSDQDQVFQCCRVVLSCCCRVVVIIPARILK